MGKAHQHLEGGQVTSKNELTTPSPQGWGEEGAGINCTLTQGKKRAQGQKEGPQNSWDLTLSYFTRAHEKGMQRGWWGATVPWDSKKRTWTFPGISENVCICRHLHLCKPTKFYIS